MSSKLARRAECHYRWGSGSSLRNLILREAGESGDLWMVTVFGLSALSPTTSDMEVLSRSQGHWFLVFILVSAKTVFVSWSVRIMKCNVGNSVVAATGRWEGVLGELVS